MEFERVEKNTLYKEDLGTNIIELLKKYPEIEQSFIQSMHELSSYEQCYLTEKRSEQLSSMDAFKLKEGRLEKVQKVGDPLTKAIQLIEQLFLIHEYVCASKLSLLCFLISESLSLPSWPYWELSVKSLHFTDNYYFSISHLYKLIGDVYGAASRTVINEGYAILYVTSYTPLLFLPKESFTMARIWATTNMNEYLSNQNAQLHYLFNDSTTRQRILNLLECDEEENNLRSILDRIKILDDKDTIKIRCFSQPLGLKSSVLGQNFGVMISGAEMHTVGTASEENAIVHLLEGEALKREISRFSEIFNSDDLSRKIDIEEFEAICSGRRGSPVQRNVGVYSDEEITRIEGQKVVIIGLGCVGGLAAEGLARMGIGELILVDDDHFELSNINRQPFADYSTRGLRKTTATKRGLSEINPRCKVEIIPEKFDIKNAEKICGMGDLILQCVDDVYARVLIHQTARDLRKPVISMTGQPPFRGFVCFFEPDGPDFIDIMGLQKEMSIKDIVNSSWASFNIKTKRAKVAATCQKHKYPGNLEEWYNRFANNANEPWAVTLERTWLMGTLMAHEAILYLSGREVHAKAPRAIIIDLEDPNMLVRVSSPEEEWKRVKESKIEGVRLADKKNDQYYWNYRCF